jgi:hypothetical protein
MTQWTNVKTVDLSALNVKLKAAGLPALRPEVQWRIAAKREHHRGALPIADSFESLGQRAFTLWTRQPPLARLPWR